MPDFSSLTTVAVRFLPHPVYLDAHVHLNTFYGGELEALDDCFADETKTALHADVVNIVKHNIIDQLIIPHAIKTVDTTRITPLILQATFSVPTTHAWTRLSPKSLATAMTLAAAAGQSFVEVTITPHHLDFHTTHGNDFLDWQYIRTTVIDRPLPSPPASAPAADLAKDALKAAVGGVDDVLPAVCDSTSASVSDPPPALSITADDMEPAFADAVSALPQPSPVDLAAAIAPALATIVLGHIDRLDCLTVAAGKLYVLQPAPRPHALLRAMVHCQDVTHCGIRTCYPIVDPTAMPFGLYIDPIRCYPFDPGGGYVSCQTLQSQYDAAPFPLTAVPTPYLVCDGVLTGRTRTDHRGLRPMHSFFFSSDRLHSIVPRP